MGFIFKLIPRLIDAFNTFDQEKNLPVIRSCLFIAFFLSTACASAQKLKKEDKLLVENLQTHIVFLSSDQLQGRRTGTEGEKLAANYISARFQAAGLEPKGTENYLQPFVVNEGRQINSSTHFIIDGNHLEINKDFFPLDLSNNGSITAFPSLALQESGSPWFFDIGELLDDNKSNPHFDAASALDEKIKSLQSKGATAIIVYNSSEINDGLKFSGRNQDQKWNIPVVYLAKPLVKKFLSDTSASLDLQMKIDIGPKTRSGMNVVGFIDNHAAETVVLGAHFDHLGWGEDRNSMYRTEPKQIHNGADDNASGTAALIELARLLKASKYKNANYLFIAFSGEELGLYGSKYFTEHPTINLSSVRYMLNMDMVGRLNDSSHVITVGGYGTSPLWGSLYHLTGKKKLFQDKLAFRFDSSGTGPSDHTSFYRKDIPVLFYFTGLHQDYHRPTDDPQKINYNGEAIIVKHIVSLIEHTDKNPGKPEFTKTREVATSTNAAFKVTLGIMPDYTFSGNGVRVDGVTSGRPAEKAGMKTGDVILSLGEIKINSLEDYMQALGKFKKGDKTTVSFKRGPETISSSVEF
jgi:aminopeptidase YwaD